MQNFNSLTAISPVDGRYRDKVDTLGKYFSEFALIHYRVKVEIEYFIALCEIPLPQLKSFPHQTFTQLRNLYESFSIDDALYIKETESITNHDVKAVEYFIKEKFDQLKLGDFKEFVHFGLTSQDINNTAIPWSLQDFVKVELIPTIDNLIDLLKSSASEWSDISMLARTHGQPASPTRLGKEIDVFVSRLFKQKAYLTDNLFSAKFGGATGNMNAHNVAYPGIDWHTFAENFISEKLGLTRSFPTTQIEHYDQLANLFDCIKRINTILIDLSRDMWSYISLNYFSQKIKANEVGSSAMPHKVNPIDFENAEGNLGVANSILEHLSSKLPVSRLQRDLTDSTVLRNIGVPLAHGMIAINSILKGWKKLQCNKSVIANDLEDNWAVVAEAIQTILRRENYPSPYEALKELTRTNEKITKESIHTFIDGLDVEEDLKKELKEISPFNYTGK